MKQEYFTCRVAAIQPLLKGLKNSEINVQKLIKKSKLRRFDLAEPKNYIPANAMYDFLAKVKEQVPTGTLAQATYNYFEVSEISIYGDFFMRLPTLHSLLYQLTVSDSVFQSNISNHLAVKEHTVKFSFSILGRKASGQRLAENIWLATILKLFNSFCGNDWSPIEFHTPYSVITDISAVLPRGGYCIKLNQPEYAIIFCRSELNRIKHGSFDYSHENWAKYSQAEDVVSTIRSVLNSYKPGYIPSLKELSYHFDTSESSIKRCLKSYESKFSIILGKALLNKSIELLDQTDMNITLISEYLGYSDSPNFIRSFKKWTGTTPALYRNNMKPVLK